MSVRLRSNEENYAWECAENMRQWAMRAEATTKVWAARASAAEAVLRRIARECRHYDDFPEPCAACVAELGLTTESAPKRTTPKPRLDYGPYDPAGITELLLNPAGFLPVTQEEG